MGTNSTIDRRIQFYPSPHYSKLLTAYRFINGQYDSEVVKEAVKKFFDDMKPEEKQKLLVIYEEMTPLERNPGKKPKRE